MSKKISNKKKNEHKAMMNGISHSPKQYCRNCGVEIKRGQHGHFLGQVTLADALNPNLRLNDPTYYSCEPKNKE